MAPVPTQTVLSLASSPVPSTSTVSLLPFSLAHDGPAPIATYFHPRPYPDGGAAGAPHQEGSEAAHRQAAFRGRRIVSSMLSLPEGYRGLVYSTTAPLPPSHDGDADDSTQGTEGDERAAKRAKRAAASAAALDAVLPDSDTPADSAADPNVRRSPRKTTSAASSRARERAIRAAKEKAKRRSAAGKVQPRQGFSLDSDEEEEGGAKEPLPVEATEEMKTAEPVEAEINEAELALDTSTTAETTQQDKLVDASDASLLQDAPREVELPLSTVEPAIAPLAESAAASPPPPPPPPPAPLRTVSTVSVASSTLISSTPRSPSPASQPEPSPLAADVKEVSIASSSAAHNRDHDHEAPILLARDEKRLVPSLTFDKIEIWNPDWPLAGGKVTEDDEVGRAVFEWIGLASKIHAY
ncbi:hypothetical protein JCM10908_007056 [Rhodotorula pacifica]|uniref:uncharacterized protein n=1 Tax=Rhodotorula pacifica TaxID=1495444 RepID=UPI003178EAE9